jgi:hypothetical protein
MTIDTELQAFARELEQPEMPPQALDDFLAVYLPHCPPKEHGAITERWERVVREGTALVGTGWRPDLSHFPTAELHAYLAWATDAWGMSEGELWERCRRRLLTRGGRRR